MRHAVAVAQHAGRANPALDRAALLFDAFAGHLPHLAGAVAGILEFLDQAGGVVGARDRIDDRFGKRKVLDPLRRPVRANIGGGDAPHLFRVAPKEVHVEPPAEAVLDPLFETVLVPVRAHPPLDVAEDDPRAFVDPDIGQGIENLERVIVVLPAVVDPALARNGDEFVAKHLAPHLLDFANLGEEAVAADIEAIALVRLGPGDPAHQVARFEHHRAIIVRTALQLVCGGQPAGPPPITTTCFLSCFSAIISMTSPVADACKGNKTPRRTTGCKPRGSGVRPRNGWNRSAAPICTGVGEREP